MTVGRANLHHRLRNEAASIEATAFIGYLLVEAVICVWTRATGTTIRGRGNDWHTFDNSPGTRWSRRLVDVVGSLCPRPTLKACLLEHAAEHGNRGTLGCFVEVEPERDGSVSVTLYERWFKGRHLLCERLASRRFDAGDEDTLVISAEYLVELQHQAAERNQLREAAALDTNDVDNNGGREGDDRVKAAEWLAELLADHCQPSRLGARRSRR